MSKGTNLLDLREEVHQVRLRHPNLSDDNAFCFWFIHAYLTDDEERVRDALVGGARDVGADAIFADPDAHRIYVIQSKYRTRPKPVHESRNDVLAFGQLGEDLIGDKRSFEARLAQANAVVRDRLQEIRHKITHSDYRLRLVYVTTGAVSRGLDDEVQARAQDRFDCIVFQRPDVLRLLEDYIDGAAPPVPLLDLPIDGDTFLRRYDPALGIESWVFSMRGTDVARIYGDAGVRLFARNIRGFLGRKTDVNKGLEHSLRREPDRFWYYNNGITIVCDSAHDTGRGGERRLRVTHAQVINGQQTTRVIEEVGGKRASVLVRVIAIPRASDNGAYDSLVGRIVEATNWQNAIEHSDLMSNDAEQVRLERELRKRSYAYLRKRASKGEARRLVRFKPIAFIKKQEIAQFVGACILDPFEVRLGKERLFEPDLYPKVFAQRPMNLCLTMYWLGRAVGYVSRGYSRRGYAKWVVLHFLWDQLEGFFRAPSTRDLFVRSWEHEWWSGGDVFKSLCQCIEMVFKAANRFYFRQRGKGPSQFDESTFYKRRGLHDRFSTFWLNGKHPYRRSFSRSVKRFTESIHEYEGTP